LSVFISHTLNTGFRDEDVYITGLCHDIGFLIYGESFRYPEFIQNLEYHVSSEGVLSFDIFYTVDRFDRNCQHVLISSKILEYMGIVPAYCSRAILYHHSTTFPAHEDEKTVLMANIIRLADHISGTIRSARKLEEAVEQVRISVEKEDFPPALLKTGKDLVNDPIIFSSVFNEESGVDKFMESMLVDVKTFTRTAQIISLMLDYRSVYTRKHSLGVAKLSENLARELLTETDAVLMYLSGIMHDFGKIRTPLHILHKPGALSPGEMFVMKLHVVDAMKLLTSPRLTLPLRMAVMHHERLDGSGYPKGLKAKDIPFQARILQVADVYTALAEDRPYRKSLEPTRALKIVENMVRANQLDGIIYEKLREFVKNGYHLTGYEDLIEMITQKYTYDGV